MQRMKPNNYRPCLLLLLLLAIPATLLHAQDLKLTVVVQGLKVIKGSSVMIAVYNSEETYFDADRMFASAEVKVENETLTYTFESFPAGDYAVTLYHDEDGNGEMDRKWYGPPREGYAFSNNFTSSMRPARYEDAVFTMEVDKTITVNMVY